jgi:hypothetical protein
VQEINRRFGKQAVMSVGPLQIPPEFLSGDDARLFARVFVLFSLVPTHRLSRRFAEIHQHLNFCGMAAITPGLTKSYSFNKAIFMM